jgi:hypothetical protein
MTLHEQEANAPRRRRPALNPFTAVALGAAFALGATLLFVTPREHGAIAATPDAAAIPRTAEGKPDFSGIWESLGGADYGLEPHGGRPDAPPGIGFVKGGRIPYLPEALEQRNRNFAERATADVTRLQCHTLGVPRSVYYPEPFQIFQRPRDLTLIGQFGAVRTINTNGTRHPEGPIGFWLGDSRAHWEGDTLVASVQDFTADTWLDRSGNFHSEALRVTERWSFLDANTINYEATLEDPEVFSEPWTLNVILHRHREPNFQLIENVCFTHEYDDYYPYPKDLTGNIQ